MIVLSLLLVVVSATALGWGIITTSEQLVWASLLAGLAAMALVAGSVVRYRRRFAAAETSTPTRPDPAVPAVADPPRPIGSGPAGPGAAAAPGTAPARAWPWSADAAGTVPSRSGWSAEVAPAPPASLAEPGPAPAGGHPPAAPAGAAGSGAESAGTAAAAAVGAPPDRPLGEPFPEPPVDDGEPPVEDVPVRDALRVAQLADEVRVVDGHPRYHLGECPTLAGAEPVPLPVSAARRGGFTPCAVCAPDRVLLARSRDRRGPPADRA